MCGFTSARAGGVAGEKECVKEEDAGVTPITKGSKGKDEVPEEKIFGTWGSRRAGKCDQQNGVVRGGQGLEEN